MAQDLTVNIKTTSDVPQAMEKSKSAVVSFSKQVEDIQKKFSTAFKDIFLGFTAPMVLLQGTISIISNAIAKKVFEALWNGEGATADEVIDKQGLKQVTDTGAIEAMIDEVLAANQKSVDEFRAGKEKAFNALVGQVMKASKGKADGKVVTAIIQSRR